MKLKQLPRKAVEVLMSRLSDEQTARYFYESAAAWCQNKGYQKAAQFFLKESTAESAHGAKIIKFLSDWNEPVKFKAINAPSNEFSSLLDVIEQAYMIEYDLLGSYEVGARDIMAESMVVFNLLNEFVSVQNESVIEYADLLNKAANYEELGKSLALFEEEVF